MAPLCRFGSFTLTDIHQAIAGKPAASRPAAQPKGLDGSFMLLPDVYGISWLHPNALRMVLAHAKDVYRTGHLPESASILQTYAGVLRDSGGWLPEHAAAFAQAKNEIAAMLFRISANLDYFGHTAGWVPLLSLESMMRAFQDEVKAAVPVIFLSQWLQAKALQNIKDTTALQDAMEEVGDVSRSVAAEVNATLDTLPSLQVEAANISAQLQGIQARLIQRRDELLAKAQRDVEAQRRVPTWMKGLRTLATVAQMVPVYQPALGSIGKGLDILLQNFDPANPFDIVQSIPELSGQMKASTCSQSASTLKAFLNGLDFDNLSASKENAKNLGDRFSACATLVKEGTAIWQDVTIADTDVKRAFDALTESDPQFQDLTREVSDFTTRKQRFAQALANALNLVSSGQSRIAANLVAVGSMYEDLNSAATRLDHSTVSYIQDMDRRARERLLRYQ